MVICVYFESNVVNLFLLLIKHITDPENEVSANAEASGCIGSRLPMK